MGDVTQILLQIESGDPSRADELLPLVYQELRKLAAARLAQEKPGQTLQATALVHEAYLLLADAQVDWVDRAHFFGIAARQGLVFQPQFDGRAQGAVGIAGNRQQHHHVEQEDQHDLRRLRTEAAWQEHHHGQGPEETAEPITP